MILHIFASVLSITASSSSSSLHYFASPLLFFVLLQMLASSTQRWSGVRIHGQKAQRTLFFFPQEPRNNSTGD